MACIVWLIIAITLLFAFSSSIQVDFPSGKTGGCRRLLELMILPYRTTRQPLAQAKERKSAETSASRTWPISPSSPQDADPPAAICNELIVPPAHGRTPPTFLIRIEMKSENGPRSWKVYEGCIEALAVGIYLYATFVLTSVVFLSGQEAMIYMVVTVLAQSAVRVLGLLF